MSNLTALIANSIRVYPSLYPTRLSVLTTIFSRYSSGGMRINEATGSFESERDPMGREEPQFDEIEDGALARIKRLQEQAQERWISENSAEIAKDSTFDELGYLNKLAWPTVGLHPSRELEWDEMSKETQAAFQEVLYHYEKAYDDAVRVRDWPPARDGLGSKSWDLTNPRIAKLLGDALLLLERITGKTHEERNVERTKFIDELMAEMKAEGKL